MGAKKRVNETQFKDQTIRPALDTILKLFAVKQLMDDSEPLFETGFFTSGSGQLRDAAFKKLLVDLRPNMLGLVEYSPNFESALATTIGNKYGDIYEKQLEV